MIVKAKVAAKKHAAKKAVVAKKVAAKKAVAKKAIAHKKKAAAHKKAIAKHQKIVRHHAKQAAKHIKKAKKAHKAKAIKKAVKHAKKALKKHVAKAKKVQRHKTAKKMARHAKLMKKHTSAWKKQPKAFRSMIESMVLSTRKEISIARANLHKSAKAYRTAVVGTAKCMRSMKCVSAHFNKRKDGAACMKNKACKAAVTHMIHTTFTRKVAFRCMMNKKGCAMKI